MLNLWSRVGRVGCSCRCPSCLTTKHALVRRVSTAIGRFRARPKTSSTFLYSAIFAAATVTDGHVKRQRRAKWDDAIQKAQQQLEETQRAIKSHGDSSSEEETADKHLEPESEEHKRYQQEDNHIHLLDVESVMKYAPRPGAPRPMDSLTTEPRSIHSPWRREETAPQSLWSGEIRRVQAWQRRWTKKKLAKAELAAARLAVEMIMLIGLESQIMINLVILPEAVQEIARLSRSEQRQLLKDLKRDLINCDKLESWEGRSGSIADMTIPQYSQREDNSHRPIVDELNESILGLLRAYEKRDIGFKALVVKVAHNLLVSPSPPDLQTVNIILLGFLNLDTAMRHSVVDYMIHFCRTIKVRPNELTCATILRNYTKTNSAQRFIEFIGLMRAADGKRGLMLAKPGITITSSSNGRLIAHDEREGKVFQAVNPSALVLWQIVRGVLKFSGLEAAIAICKNFNIVKWGLDRTCLYELLRQSVRDEDWKSGRWVWDKVQEFHEQKHNASLASIVGMMLALCVRCNETYTFYRVFEEALEQKYQFKLRSGQITPATLTMLAHRALQTADRDTSARNENGQEEIPVDGEDESQDGVGITRPSDRELAAARRTLGMGSKSLDLDSHRPEHSDNELYQPRDSKDIAELSEDVKWWFNEDLQGRDDQDKRSGQQSSKSDYKENGGEVPKS